MSDTDGLRSAHILDGKGGGRPVGWGDIRAWTPADGVLWMHLDLDAPEARRWITGESGIDPIACDALLVETSRPRMTEAEEGLVVNLRGVNLNPGAAPEDMVGIRMFIDGRRIVSLCRRRLLAAEDLGGALVAGTGPKDTADLLVRLADRLAARMGPVLENLDDKVDRLEDLAFENPDAIPHAELSDLRRTAIVLRRYLAPQRDALAALLAQRPNWMDKAHRARLAEVGDRTTRYVEDLNEVRERTSVLQDEVRNQLTERMNRTMYLLSVVAAVLLPPGLIAGVLGANVGGVPWTEDPWGFSVMVGLIVVLAVVEVWILRRLKWL